MKRIRFAKPQIKTDFGEGIVWGIFQEQLIWDTDEADSLREDTDENGFFWEQLIWDTDEADSLCEDTDNPDGYRDGVW